MMHVKPEKLSKTFKAIYKKPSLTVGTMITWVQMHEVSKLLKLNTIPKALCQSQEFHELVTGLVHHV